MDKKNKNQDLKPYNEKRRGRAGSAVSSPTAISEDYLARFNAEPTSYNEYNKMRKGDYQVKRMLNVLKGPIRSAKFRYFPVDTKDEEQKKQAMFKTRFYRQHPIKRWEDIISEILLKLDFGFSYFEPTSHTVEDPDLGAIVTLKDLGYIKQTTITKWVRKAGELVAIEQQYSDQNGESATVEIPIEDLIMFINDREGDNYKGVSVLRSAYGSWVRKDLYLKLDMIGLERMAIGTPIVFAPKSLLNNRQDNEYLFETVRKYLANEQAGIVLDDRLKEGFEILKGEYKSDAIDSSIKREDMGMLDSILASFLSIGTGRAGGNAQNEGQMEMFLNSLLFIAESIANILDDLAHRYYVINFGEPEVRLNMDISGIANNDLKREMEVIRGYVTADIIRGDVILESFIRNRLGLPGKDEATERDPSMSEMSTEYQAVEDEDEKKNRKPQKSPEKPSSK